MPFRKKALLSWSSGKDSAWALEALKSLELEIVGLLSVLNVEAKRVSMHGVREELLDAQALAAGLPLRKVYIPSPCTNDEYEAAVKEAMLSAKSEGVTCVAFGDLFLEDIRKYREEKLQAVCMEPIFPLWDSDTKKLANEMARSGLKARVTCVDSKQLDARFVGRDFDDDFLSELPPSVDPCGERGEYHSFAYDGPMFSRPIPVRPGEVVVRDGFHFADFFLDDGR